MTIDRRTFVAGLGVGIAGAAAGVSGAQPAGEVAGNGAWGRRAPGRIRLSLKYGMIQEGETVAEKFAIARDAGFDGVEMDSPNGLDTGEVLAAREETGIEIPGVVDSAHWGKPLSHPDARVRAQGRHALETALLDCEAYGGTMVLLVPAVVNASVSYAEAYARSQEEIERVLPLAAELGVSIAIENVWNHFLLSPLEAARYVDELGSRKVERVLRDRDGQALVRVPAGRPGGAAYRGQRLVGWYLDLGNIVNYGWPEHWIRALGGQRLLRLDVKDFSRTKRDEEGLWKGFGVEIGEGDVDWAAVRTALAEVGYRGGWASAEVGGGDRRRLADIASRMDLAVNGPGG